MHITDITVGDSLGLGINTTSSGRTNNGQMVYIKQHDAHYSAKASTIDVTAEIAGALFAKQVGLLSADFLLAMRNDRTGVWTSVQTGLPGKPLCDFGASGDYGACERLPITVQDARGFFLLDNLTSNWDRHTGNALHDEATGRTHPIDHGMARCERGYIGNPLAFRGSVSRMRVDSVWREESRLLETFGKIDPEPVVSATMDLMSGQADTDYFARIGEQMEFMYDSLTEGKVY